MSTTTHLGPAFLISPASSAGLVFLSKLLPALDSLAPSADHLFTLMSPQTRFVINNGVATTLEQAAPMFSKRSEAVFEFGHELGRAWDIDQGVVDGKAKRELMFESVSQTVLRADPDKVRIAVAEFSVVELEADESGELKVVEIRTWMNGSAVAARRAAITGTEAPPQGL